jgi:hypothetical protein
MADATEAPIDRQQAQLLVMYIEQAKPIIATFASTWEAMAPLLNNLTMVANGLAEGVIRARVQEPAPPETDTATKVKADTDGSPASKE